MRRVLLPAFILRVALFYPIYNPALLMEEVNSEGNGYDYVVSERLGRTSSKKQYMYIYNSSTISITGTPHTILKQMVTSSTESHILLHSRMNDGNYDGVLICIHTDPDEVTEDINGLDEVLEYEQGIYEGEKVFIIMGAFNADVHILTKMELLLLIHTVG